MLPKGVTLRGLEVFEALAATGSVAQAAQSTGLSQPAVSQQLRNLETALGVDLIDHGKRPMRLTVQGEHFRLRAESALRELRLAQSELTVMDLRHLTSLALGVIDDFDNDLTPRLVTVLADSLTGCRFKLITAPSHEILDMVADRRLHIAISASPGVETEGVLEFQLATDPFILVAPKSRTSGDTLDAPPTDLPFLRYEQEQLIARQIEAHLTRNHLSFEDRFEVGSHLALMAMVARGIGWAITTPMGYMRAGRFHDKVSAFPLPFDPFSRTISLFASADWAADVPVDIATTMRKLIETQMIEPALHKLPWLGTDMRLLGP